MDPFINARSNLLAASVVAIAICTAGGRFSGHGGLGFFGITFENTYVLYVVATLLLIYFRWRYYLAVETLELIQRSLNADIHKRMGDDVNFVDVVKNGQKNMQNRK